MVELGICLGWGGNLGVAHLDNYASSRDGTRKTRGKSYESDETTGSD